MFSISIDVLQAYLFLNKYQVISKSNKLQIPKRKTYVLELEIDDTHNMHVLPYTLWTFVVSTCWFLIYLVLFSRTSHLYIPLVKKQRGVWVSCKRFNIQWLSGWLLFNSKQCPGENKPHSMKGWWYLFCTGPTCLVFTVYR